MRPPIRAANISPNSRLSRVSPRPCELHKRTVMTTSLAIGFRSCLRRTPPPGHWTRRNKNFLLRDEPKKCLKTIRPFRMRPPSAPPRTLGHSKQFSVLSPEYVPGPAENGNSCDDAFEPTPFAWTLANVGINISAAKRTPEVIENTKPAPDQLRLQRPDLPRKPSPAANFLDLIRAMRYTFFSFVAGPSFFSPSIEPSRRLAYAPRCDHYH